AASPPISATASSASRRGTSERPQESPDRPQCPPRPRRGSPPTIPQEHGELCRRARPDGQGVAVPAAGEDASRGPRGRGGARSEGPAPPPHLPRPLSGSRRGRLDGPGSSPALQPAPLDAAPPPPSH